MGSGLNLNLDTLGSLADELEEEQRRRAGGGGYSWSLRARVPVSEEVPTEAPVRPPVEPLPPGEYAPRPEIKPEPLAPRAQPELPPDTLPEAEAQAARSRGLARIQEAGDLARVAIGGGKRNPLYQQLIAEAERPIQEAAGARKRAMENTAFTRQGQQHELAMQQGEEALRTKRSAAAKAAEEEALYGDPQSQVSQTAVAIIGERMPRLGERVKGMSASEIFKLNPLLKGLMEADARMQLAKQNDAARLAEISLSGRQGQDLARLKAKLRGEAGGGGTGFTGFVAMPGRSMQKQEEVKFRGAQAGVERLTSNLREMLGILNVTGPERLPTAARERLIALYEDISYAIKDKEQMGALQAAEIAKIERAVPDQTTFMRTFSDAVGLDNTKERLRMLGTLANSGLVATGLTLGLAPDPEGPYAKYLKGQRLEQYAGGGGQSAPSGGGKIKMTDGNEELWVLPEDEEEAAADGFRRAP